VTGYKIDRRFECVVTNVQISSVGLLADKGTKMLTYREDQGAVMESAQCRQTWV